MDTGGYRLEVVFSFEVRFKKKELFTFIYYYLKLSETYLQTNSVVTWHSKQIQTWQINCQSD